MDLDWRWDEPGSRSSRTFNRQMDRSLSLKRCDRTWAGWKRSVSSKQNAVGREKGSGDSSAHCPLSFTDVIRLFPAHYLITTSNGISSVDSPLFIRPSNVM